MTSLPALFENLRYKKVPRTRHQVIKKQTKSKKEKMKVP
jgi:hypothetical protein